MKHRRHLLLAALLTATPLSLVAQSVQPSGTAAPPLPSITLAPELDRVLRDYERAWRAGDAAALAQLFAEDGFILQGGRQPVRGRANIQAAYAGQAGGDLRLRALAAHTSGDVGYIVGAYAYGENPGDVGKFTLTLRLVGGRWMIFSDMDNPSQPMRRPPPAPANPPAPTPPAS